MCKREFLLEIIKIIISWPVVGFFIFLIIFSSFDLKDLKAVLNTLHESGVASITVGSNSLDFDLPDDKVEEFEDEAFKIAVEAFEGTEEEGPELYDKIHERTKALTITKSFDYWIKTEPNHPAPTEALNEIFLGDKIALDLQVTYDDYLMAVDEIRGIGHRIEYVLTEPEFIDRMYQTEKRFLEHTKDIPKEQYSQNIDNHIAKID